MTRNYLGDPRSHIMLALDLPDRRSALQTLDECAEYVDTIKFNYPLVLQEGLGIVREVKERYGLPIVADFKVADVPVTNNRIVRHVADAGADAVMAHGFIGSDALAEIVDECAGRIGVIVVTELTHPGGLQFTREHSLDFARIARFLGCYGIQAPGTRPERVAELRAEVGPDLTIVSCGIGAQGGSFRAAIDAGADYAIIGRGIYAAESPAAAAAEFAREVSHEPAALAEG